MDSIVSPKVKTIKGGVGAFLSSQHFGGKGVCQDGTRKIDKQINYSHGPAQTKQQVG
jgi:hypothetical protein